MKLAELVIDNVGGAPDGAYRFVDPDGVPFGVTVLHGPPRRGLSALLRAIVVAAESIHTHAAPPDRGSLLRRGATSGFVQATWRLDEDEQQLCGLDSPEWTFRVPLAAGSVPDFANPRIATLMREGRAKLELFAADRLLPGPTGSPPTFSEERSFRTKSHPRKYAGLRHAVAESQQRDADAILRAISTQGLVTSFEKPDSLRAAKDALARMLPHLRMQGAVTGSGSAPREQALLQFVRKDGTLLELGDLSGSEKQAVLFVLTVHRFGLGQAILLVDEPELHVHPDEQAAFLADLGALVPKGQMIVATHAEAVVAAVFEAQRVRLGGRG